MYLITTGALALYALSVGALYAAQDRMIFPRHRACAPQGLYTKGGKTLRVATSDGEQLVGVHLPAERSRGLIVGFTGNIWDAGYFAACVHDWTDGFDVVAFHYRGYAPSTGLPSEAALTRDAETIYDAVIEELAPERVYAAGFSLGSAVAAHLATQRPLDGLVLVTPFDSLHALAKTKYRLVPVRWLLKHPFHTDRRLAATSLPVGVISARRDQIIPPARTLSLGEHIDRLVFNHVFADDTHSSLYDRPSFGNVLQAAFEALENDVAEPLSA
ncbi:MAG: alpha/beta hydrolase [Geminicoccaceae bacterium]